MKVLKVLILILGLISIGIVVVSFSRNGKLPADATRSASDGTVSAQDRSATTIANAKTTQPTERSSTTNNVTAAATSGPRAPVAVVNGTVITAGELEDELNHLLISAASHTGMDQKKRDELRKSALDELIVRELAYQKAKSSGVTVPPLDLVAGFRRIRSRYKSEKDFQQALAAEQITEQELRRRVERDLLLKKILQLEVEDKAKVSDTEVRKHYEDNKQKFVVPESVQCKGILIKIGTGGDVEAKRKIDELFTKLKAGGDFGELAYKFSEDDYRWVGGDYGSVHRGQLVPDLERVIFAQKVGELSPPFKTSLGWHIVLVQKKQAQHQLSYPDVQDRIRTALFQQREKQKRLEFIASLKSGANIEYVTQ